MEWLQDVQCVCDDGYEGRECGEEVDECVGVECQNGGSCEDQHASFVCRCPAQFTGAWDPQTLVTRSIHSQFVFLEMKYLVSRVVLRRIRSLLK